MAKTVKIRPLGGYEITDPATMRPLPKEGEAVEWSVFWQRRLNSGEIEVLSAPEQAQEAE